MYPDIPAGLALAFVARAAGISPFIVGMVIVGFGTSAPELAVSALAGCAGHANLSLGNAFGSNFFNALAVVGTSGAISPFRDVSPLVFTRDLPVMVLLTLSIGIFGFSIAMISVLSAFLLFPWRFENAGPVKGRIWYNTGVMRICAPILKPNGDWLCPRRRQQRKPRTC